MYMVVDLETWLSDFVEVWIWLEVVVPSWGRELVCGMVVCLRCVPHTVVPCQELGFDWAPM